MNADLGYDNPGVRPTDYRTNLINVEGLKSVHFSSAQRPRSSCRARRAGTTPPRPTGAGPVPQRHGPGEVADELDSVLEQLFHNPTLITETGLSYADGDTFMLEDGVHAPVIYEFEAALCWRSRSGGGSVADGGIEDGEYFTVTDSSGLMQQRSSSTRTTA